MRKLIPIRFSRDDFCSLFVKILVNPSGFTAFLPCTPKNPLFTKFYDLKGAVFCVDFGEAKPIRLTPMGAGEPKAA